MDQQKRVFYFLMKGKIKEINKNEYSFKISIDKVKFSSNLYHNIK